jgi:hypothetical protein
MNKGKTAENGKLMISPNCRNYFGQLRKNVENLDNMILIDFGGAEIIKLSRGDLINRLNFSPK